MTEELKGHLTRIETKLDSHIGRFEEWQSELKTAFPKDDEGGTDFRSHREYHKKLIDDAVEFQAAKARTMEKVISGGIWGAIVLIATALWHYMVAKIGGV